MQMINERTPARLLAAPLILFVATHLAGCSGGGGLSGSAPLPNVEEPSGGQWRTVLLASGSTLAVPPPPAANGAVTAREVQELLSLQSSRTAAMRVSVNFWNAGAVIRWNEIARSLVTQHSTNPPVASRIYAYLSVAQYDALVTAWHYKYLYRRPEPRQLNSSLVPLVATGPTPVYPSEHATVAAASAAVLAFFYPTDAALLTAKVREHQESRLIAGVNFRSDIEAADALGRAVAAKAIERARTDNSTSAGPGSFPSGPGNWNGINPLLPGWGDVKPWLMTSGSQFRPPAPPAFDSPEFRAALAEVRQISNTRTPEQLRIAQFWADGPPGHWNEIASDLIAEHALNELRAARTLALMNMAVMDAGICCWDAKYTYFYIRPFQVDPAITTPVGRPNFPSYTSGHSTFSGAASEVLGYVFSDRQAVLRDMAEEASISRVYGGIHYLFDCTEGLEGGRTIGQLAVQRGQADGSPGF